MTEAEWNDWTWHMKNGIRDIETLEKVVELTDLEREQIRQCLGKFTMEITPYYAALMDRDDPECPVRMQSVPRIAEMHDDPSDMADPLHEDVDSPVPGLTHRYPDRVLLLVTNICSMNCRHCTRRRLVGDEDVDMPEDNVSAAIDYIRDDPDRARRPPQRRRPARPAGRTSSGRSSGACGRSRTSRSSGSGRGCRSSCRSGSRTGS